MSSNGIAGIDIDSLPLKYITGSYRFGKGYPDCMDFLYDLVQTGRGSVKLESADWVEPVVALRLCRELEDMGFVEMKNGNTINIKRTPWDRA